MARLQRKNLHMDSVQAYASCVCIASICPCDCGGKQEYVRATNNNFDFWQDAVVESMQM